MSEQAYPLHWPNSWPRTDVPKGSQFKTSLSGALRNVQDSLRRFAADSGKDLDRVLISSNFTLMDSEPEDAGVALYFTWDGLESCIAVDRYRKLAHNLQAIHHVIEAKRTMLRHGGLNVVRAAFRGYAALPPPGSGNKESWRSVLDVGPRCDLKTAEKVYRDMARAAHPDNGGSRAQMARLNSAIAEARQEFSRNG